MSDPLIFSAQEQEMILNNRKRLLMVEGYKMGLHEALNKLDAFQNDPANDVAKDTLMNLRRVLRDSLTYESRYPPRLKP